MYINENLERNTDFMNKDTSDKNLEIGFVLNEKWIILEFIDKGGWVKFIGRIRLI